MRNVSPVEPSFRSNDSAVSMRRQPYSPPAEGAVADDVMAAVDHKHHVLPTVVARIGIHVSGIRYAQILLHPIHVVREDVEECRRVSGEYGVYGTLIVVQSADAAR